MIELPEPRAIRAGHSFPKVYAQAYTADQMREYAAKCVAEEREACAKVCEEIAKEWSGSGLPRYACNDAANAIRARSDAGGTTGG